MKNLIQERLNNDSRIDSLKSAIRGIHDKYIIEHAVFGLDENFVPCEVCNGYFEKAAEYDNLDECLQNLKETNECIYIESAYAKDENNKRTLTEKFTIGTFRPALSECDHSKQVMDISDLKIIDIQ